MNDVIDLLELSETCTEAVRWYDDLLAGHDQGLGALDLALRRLSGLPSLPGRLGWAVRALTQPSPDRLGDPIVVESAFDVLRCYVRALVVRVTEPGSAAPPFDDGQLVLPGID